MDINIVKCEEEFLMLFCKKFRFSDNLYKYEDDVVFDMYDHNQFVSNRNTSAEEIYKAIQYQKDKGRDFLKIISEERLNRKVIKELGLEENTYLTMLHDNKTDRFKVNDKVVIKNINLKDLNTIELKHYGKIYGEGFVKRRNKEFYKASKKDDGFTYYGAYINNKIVGACHTYTYNNYTCLDSLLVDNRYRHRYIASTMLKYARDNSVNFYLHADYDDYPRQIYKKMGFRVVGKEYEYYKKI